MLLCPTDRIFSKRHSRLLAFVQLGGMGFIHYNCTLAEQAAAVEAVKSHQPGCAPSVRTVAPDATVADVVSVRALPSLYVAAMLTFNHDGLICWFSTASRVSQSAGGWLGVCHQRWGQARCPAGACPALKDEKQQR